MNYEFFERLNRLIPGSVSIDRENSTVTLVGWKLEEFYSSGQKQSGSDHVEEETGGFKGSLPESEDSFPKHIFLVDGRFKRVVNPLANTNCHTSKCHKASSSSWISRKHPGASEEEDKTSEGDKDFVPSVKSKLRKWVLQVFRFLFMAIRKS
ncbi:hypothetical protein ACTVPV_04710 [Serratia bockelmannii]|uniref:hypothetical protein n=1 Tax=Serratia bockelmannii TaxID=2703793 RepID=UPI003FA6A33D